MELNEKTIKEISAIIVIIIFAILVFFTMRPILYAIIWGLILAYVFAPVFRWANQYVTNKSLCASIVLLLVLVIIALPIWFIIPVLVQQTFEIFKFSQTLDIYNFANSIFPTATPQFLTQITAAVNAITAKLNSAIINSLVGTFTNIPLIILNVIIAGFVFFFTLRDGEKMKNFIKGISPLSKSKERILIKHFKDVTYSILYGSLVVGVVQGLLAGFGFWLFGINNYLALGVLGVFLAILPFAGVFLLWIPIAIYMFAAGNIGTAIAFTLYNAIIVSNVDNLIFAYIVSRRTNLSTLFAFISSIGGLFVFGVLGLILGPLIFAYFIILIDMYREKNLLNLFAEDETQPSQAQVQHYETPTNK